MKKNVNEMEGGEKMLTADINTIKIMIKNEEFEDLKSHHIGGGIPIAEVLINLYPDPFKKTGMFPNEKRGGLVEERTYVDYQTPMDQIIETIKNNKRKFLK